MTATISNANTKSSEMATTEPLSSWNGHAMTQADMMRADRVLCVNAKDEIIGTASKEESHALEPGSPASSGMCHRAFSVFVFDQSTQELLLQQRASSKVTFPNVWTNTCCSHPLSGMKISEVDDDPEQVAQGNVVGVKHAARRKLEHELGVAPSELPDLEQFKFLTRLHYWAKDAVTHGPNSPWGEHEIDYLLVVCLSDKSQWTLKPHPDEVQAVKWVSQDQLSNMFNDEKLLFSPWFRIIASQWLNTWWKDLDTTINTQAFCDYTKIHTLVLDQEQGQEQERGQGQQQQQCVATEVKITNGGTVGRHNQESSSDLKRDKTKKQGAYGKIPIHKEPLWQQLMHVDEVVAALVLLVFKPLKSNIESPELLQAFAHCQEELAFGYDVLVQVSRSFAAVILQLPSSMVVDTLVFYLVLRALDTVEDDTSAFKGNMDVKIKHLLAFSKEVLDSCTRTEDSDNEYSYTPWTMDGVGEGNERLLLQNFDKVQRLYASLNETSRRIIADITQRMATGMAEFVSKDLGQGTVDLSQYNRYCHFVAGLVGEGLSRLFAASGLESPSMARELHLSDQMGSFLQKTNIIRDYLEDYVDGRAFWPQDIWKKHCPELGDFAKQPQNRDAALACLAELITDALEVVPDCLLYLSKLKCPQIFRFCAIPQVMAIATLENCYANPDVFTGVVKIRKGLSCKLVLNSENLDQVHAAFNVFAKRIVAKIDAADANEKKVASLSSRTLAICEEIIHLTEAAAARQARAATHIRLLLGSLLVATLGVAVGMANKSDFVAALWNQSFWLRLTSVLLLLAGSAWSMLFLWVGPMLLQLGLKTPRKLS